MIRWLLPALLMLTLIGSAQDASSPADQPPASQPATQPAEQQTTLRKPEQARMLQILLDQQDRPVPIKAQTALSGGGPGESAPDRIPLLLEGTLLVERPGRLSRDEERPKFTFRSESGSAGPRAMPILESQLLETMEREADAGFNEFIITAEVTRYRGQNYLLLRKVLRRTEHGNLSP